MGLAHIGWGKKKGGGHAHSGWGLHKVVGAGGMQ